MIKISYFRILILNLYNSLYHISEGLHKAALCIIVKTKGSTPRKAGAKMIVLENGNIMGTIGGGTLEKEVIQQALDVLKNNTPAVYNHNLLYEHGMCCGGTVEIYIEPIINSMKILIFGAGHIGKALSKFANDLDFKVTLIDEREDSFFDFAINDVNCIQKNYRSVFKELEFNFDTCIVIVTHSHAYDREILMHCINQKFAYLGMIGSQRKVKIAEKIILENKIAGKKELSKVDMPMGVDIKASTPSEIAISILAKLIEVRNRGIKD